MSRRKLATARTEGDEGRTGTSRYSLALKIASGGMGTVYLGHLRGAAGFERPVAIKRAHPHLLGERDFVRLLLAAKADVNVTRRDGNTALSLAMQNEHAEVVELLTRAGATGN